MDEPQLLLFDCPTTVMGEGYRRLAAFKFEEAGQHFREVRQVLPLVPVQEKLNFCSGLIDGLQTATVCCGRGGCIRF